MSAASQVLSEAFLTEFLESPDWQCEAERWGWAIQRPTPLTLVVSLHARPLPGVNGAFTLKLACEFCPDLPPNILFVNPATQAYDPAVDQRHVAQLTAPDCRTHLNYGFQTPYPYGPQLVCTSLGHGYYVSGHTPTPDQRWDPLRHSVGSAIAVVQRTLVHPQYYQGRF